MIKNVLLTLTIVALLAPLAACAEPPAANSVEPNAAPEVKKPEIIQWVDTPEGRWMIHDMNRLVPPVVTPGEATCDGNVGSALSDAVALFDGNDLSKWESVKKPGTPAPWKMGDGYFETVKDSGYIRTKEKFGSCQLHIEFATPKKVVGSTRHAEIAACF